MSASGHSYICAGHRARSPRNAPGRHSLGMALLCLLSATAGARGPLGARDADYQMAVTQAYQRYQSEAAGTVAAPMVALSVIPTHYAVVVVRVDGKIWEKG